MVSVAGEEVGSVIIVGAAAAAAAAVARAGIALLDWRSNDLPRDDDNAATSSTGRIDAALPRSAVDAPVLGTVAYVGQHCG